MPYSPIRLVHIPAGSLGRGRSDALPQRFPPSRADPGRIFVVAMFTMADVAVYLAIVGHQAS
jgi:hypothetical protein